MREREREPFKHAHGTCDGNSFIMSNPSLYTQSTFVFIIFFFIYKKDILKKELKIKILHKLDLKKIINK